MTQDPLPAFTPADIDALPEGPERVVRVPHPDQGKARWLSRIETPEVTARHHSPGDPAYHYGSEGERYTVGQWGDGTWYKQRWMFP